MDLFHASNQWAKRPADERFATVQDLYHATLAYASTAQEKTMPVADIRTEAIDGEVRIIGKANNPALLTNWSFGQLASRIAAPAGYLRALPATLACQNLNHGLATMERGSGISNLLFHSNGSLLLRAFTSDKYARIWNHEVAERLLRLQEMGWTPAVPDFRFDGGDPTKCQACGGSGVAAGPAVPDPNCEKCKGTGQALPALYASDHDMFAFLRNNSITLREPGNPDGLQRGVIVENSEVGASSLRLTRFLYRGMCGNHIIWGASKMIEISIRHVGDARSRWKGYEAEIKRYAEEGSDQDEAKIASARTVRIGDTKEEVLDRLFGMRSLRLSRTTLEAGYDAAKPAEDGDPRTVWGIVQGLTRHSQTKPYADERTEIDRAAGRLMEANF